MGWDRGIGWMEGVCSDGNIRDVWSGAHRSYGATLRYLMTGSTLLLILWRESDIFKEKKNFVRSSRTLLFPLHDSDIAREDRVGE
jgi:hypothetical protein